MSSLLHSETVPLPPLSTQELANFCGELHRNISQLEQFFHVTIKVHENRVVVHGDDTKDFHQIKQVIHALCSLVKTSNITDKTLQSLLHKDMNAKTHNIKLGRKLITARNPKQVDYLEGVDKHDICFAIGPAGTGKTYLAVSKAIEAYERGAVHKLVFVRPAVEAGEKLGFLPGDLVEKVLPYLRPIYDALYEMIGFKETQKLIQNDVIEVLPLAFMRGRTLNDAFIILDEAQNTTIGQMKMYLTRIGFGSKSVITGDVTQIDLPKGTDSGLIHAMHLFKYMKEISIYTFTSKEVVRHPLISKIIDCYDNELSKKK